MTKARFHGSLDVRLTQQRKRGRLVWRLLMPLWFEHTVSGEPQVVYVPSGFLTDFASVPIVARKLIPSTGPYAAASVVHDWLYINKIGTRKEADDIFLQAMEASGVKWVTRSVIYRAVRMFGSSGWGR